MLMIIRDNDITDKSEYVEIVIPRLLTKAIVLIDKEDIDLIINKYAGITNRGYCRIRINGKLIFLHNAILKRDTTNAKVVCDHINRNKLDNRRSNLRIVSQLTNCHNINAKGYTFHKKSNSFRAYLNFNGKHYISKNLASKEEAIRIRKEYISKYCSLK